MTDYIDRQAAIDATWKEPSYTDPLNVLTEVRDRIEALPSAEVEPVKRGKWIKVSDRNYKCSVCGDWWSGEEEEIKTFIYCPNCGAKMEEEEA